MKKKLLLIALSFFCVSLLKAQQVTILSAMTIPSNPTDTDDVKAVVSTMFSSGACYVVNSSFLISGNLVLLNIAYQTGILTVICNSVDTFNLGMLPCTINHLIIQAVSTGGSVGTFGFNLPVSIGCTSVGIAEFNREQDVILFPNPISGELTVKTIGTGFAFLKISILNLLGEKIFSSTDLHPGNNPLKRIDVNGLASGIYFIRIETESGFSLKKFVRN